MERTFVLIKPDAVQRGLIGEIIARIERTGLKVVALKMVKPTKEQALKFYPSDEQWLISVANKSLTVYKQLGLDPKKDFGTDDPVEIGKIIKDWLADFLASGPCVAIVIEGNRAVEVVRKIVGATRPYEAEPGTIRGDFSTDSPELANILKRPLRNLVHAADSKEVAEKEIKFWFNDNEIINYKRADEGIIYGL
ncbi:MAG: nucleoside-diphosphate kinase [Thermoproteota archaeon]|nr:nucleoside-diphosphate kinase [Thermoproteota archaeon]MDT7886997.1 nucleoside-diphosphate kinase [Thermoproteota archaeon]